MFIFEIIVLSYISLLMEGLCIIRFYLMYEVVFEYSVVIIILGCFLLIFLFLRLLKGNNSC